MGEDNVTRHKGISALLESGAQLGTTQTYANRAAAKAQRTTQTAEAAAAAGSAANAAGSAANTALETATGLGLPQRDEIPPNRPTNVKLSPYIHGLDVIWDEPPLGDYVSRSLVTVTPQNGIPKVVSGGAFSSSVDGLDGGVPHTVSVILIDRWGLKSAASANVMGTPELSAAESINLSQLEVAGRIQGLLPLANVPVFDATKDPEAAGKFAGGVITAVAQATGSNANVLEIGEAEFENYLAGAWPPAGVVAIESATSTLSVVEVAGKKWGRLVTTAGHNSDSPLAFFAGFDPRGTIPGLSYIASVRVVNRSGVTKRVRVLRQKAGDAAGTGAAVDGSTLVFVSVPPNTETAVYSKFTADAAKPFMRLLLYCDASATVDLHNFQVEAVGAEKTQPGPYSVPAATFGAMSGRLLGVMDATIINTVIGNAAIGSAKIGSITADKILTGTMTATRITIAGTGALLAGRTIIDSGGLTLPTQAGFTDPTDPSNSDVKITASTSIAALNFYSAAVTGNSHRGASLIAVGSGAAGAPGAFRGNLVFHALIGPNTSALDSGSAVLEVRSAHTPQGARIYMKPYLELDGDLSANGYEPNLTLGFVSIPSAGSVFFDIVGSTRIPRCIIGYVSVTGGRRILPTSPGSGGIDIWVENITASGLRVRNASGSAQSVIVYAWY